MSLAAWSLVDSLLEQLSMQIVWSQEYGQKELKICDSEISSILSNSDKSLSPRVAAHMASNSISI